MVIGERAPGMREDFYALRDLRFRSKRKTPMASVGMVSGSGTDAVHVPDCLFRGRDSLIVSPCSARASPY
jgi:hypothetical protein